MSLKFCGDNIGFYTSALKICKKKTLRKGHRTYLMQLTQMHFMILLTPFIYISLTVGHPSIVFLTTAKFYCH